MAKSGSTVAKQMAALQPRLTGTETEKLATKEGTRRTIYFTKKLAGDGGYRRTGQYLGEWHDNKFEGKGTFELANGNRYVGAFKDGKRNGGKSCARMRTTMRSNKAIK